MVGTTSLQQRLVDPSTTSNGLFRTTWQSDTGLVLFRAVVNDCSVVAGCACKSTTITWALLDVADDGTFGRLAHGEDVTDGQSSLFPAVNESTGVKAFGGDEGLLAP